MATGLVPVGDENDCWRLRVWALSTKNHVIIDIEPKYILVKVSHRKMNPIWIVVLCLVWDKWVTWGPQRHSTCQSNVGSEVRELPGSELHKLGRWIDTFIQTWAVFWGWPQHPLLIPISRDMRLGGETSTISSKKRATNYGVATVRTGCLLGRTPTKLP